MTESISRSKVHDAVNGGKIQVLPDRVRQQVILPFFLYVPVRHTLPAAFQMPSAAKPGGQLLYDLPPVEQTVQIGAPDMFRPRGCPRTGPGSCFLRRC